MANQFSPGISTTEEVFTITANRTSAANACFVLESDKGEALTLINVQDKDQLEQTVGTPTNYNYQSWFQVKNALNYVSSVYITRPMLTTAKNVGIALSGGGTATPLTTNEGIELGNMYNSKLAETTLNATNLSTYQKKVASFTYNTTFTFSFLSKVNGVQFTGTATGGLQVGGTDVITIAFSAGPIYTATVVDATKIKGFGLVNTNTFSTTTPLNGASIVEDGTTPGLFHVYLTLQQVKLAFFLKDVTYANVNYAVAICSSNTTWTLPVSTTVTSTFDSYFDYKPNFAAGEFAVVEFKKNSDGSIVQENKYIASYVANAKNNLGEIIDANTYIQRISKVFNAKIASDVAPVVETTASPLFFAHHSSEKTIYPNNTAAFPNTLYTGDYSTEIAAAYDVFAVESFQADIIAAHKDDLNTASVIAKTRSDAIAVTGTFDYTKVVGVPTTTAVANEIVQFGTRGGAGTTGNFNTWNDYTVMVPNMTKELDIYSGKRRWLSNVGDVVGLYALVSGEHNTWTPAAGVNYGVFRKTGSYELAYEPSETDRANLFLNGLNPVLTDPGVGVLIFGDKTATTSEGPFSTVGIRRMVNEIKRTSKNTFKAIIFEPNDERTRDQVESGGLNILQPIISQRGLEIESTIICNEKNNPIAVREAKQLVADFFLVPIYRIRNIILRMNVTSSGISFDELIG